MKHSVAIVGMACQYPDARSPTELWENVLHRRRAFRMLPPERLRAESYVSEDRSRPDLTYVTSAAVIEGYSFDRSAFRVAGDSYRQTDLAHWLALDVASTALYDAGFPDGRGLPKDGVGVLVGNTLTGEFSRAGVMRLRWPYVFRVVDAALAEQGWTPEKRGQFLADLESSYKAPFPPVGEETLAGGLSNTIAGRICNHFDLRGGGYTVDAACASSLLAVANACSALSAGDLDVALAGGVDLSLDPFELVGFAKIGVLARDEMRVYDSRPTGFWPGEGCGMVVLMRHEDALAKGRPIYATIHGWGVSSDGQGGLTRPESTGQLLAIRRAYRRAGFGVETVGYFEGHGTGTEVGDTTELQALSKAIREGRAGAGSSPKDARLPAIGTIKANLGHTKAAAGIAGLLKAVLAVHERVIPPTTGCRSPHPLLTEDSPAISVPDESTSVAGQAPLRAGVNSMGFGGINVHVVVEGPPAREGTSIVCNHTPSSACDQDAELFLFCGTGRQDILARVRSVHSFAIRLSRAQLADLAAELERTLPQAGTWRAAVVASSPHELATRLEGLASWLEKPGDTRIDPSAGVFAGRVLESPRIGLLFPGQASPVYLKGGALARRFPGIRKLYSRAALPSSADPAATEVAQPAIAVASAAGVASLARVGLSADVAVGHSIGEFAALYWAGCLTEESLLNLVQARGKLMATLGRPGGAMASIGGNQSQVLAATRGEPVVVAAYNSPGQTVISGPSDAVNRVCEQAGTLGLRATALPVSHAFHSSFMEDVGPHLGEALAAEEIRAPLRNFVSTVTAQVFGPRCEARGSELRELLVRQLTSPVRFVEALSLADPEVDLWLEAGPGHVLSTLVKEQVDTPLVALDAGGASLQGFLQAVAAAFVLGAGLRHRELFRDRFTRPFDLDWKPQFFANPCEAGEPSGSPEALRVHPPAVSDAQALEGESTQTSPAIPTPTALPLEVVQRLVAEKLDLPVSTIPEDARLLGDLHLNSITVAEILTGAARELGLSAPRAPTEHAGATVGELARVLEELRDTGSLSLDDSEELLPPGVDDWVRPFTVEWVPAPRRLPLEAEKTDGSLRHWRVVSPPDHPLAKKLRCALPGAAGEESGAGRQVASTEEGVQGRVIVCLPAEPDRQSIELLLEAGRAALHRGQEGRFILIHEGIGASFAKTLHLEGHGLTTCAIQVPADHPEAVEWVLTEAMSARGHTDVRYDRSGRRTEPVLRPTPRVTPSSMAPSSMAPSSMAPPSTEKPVLPLGPEDVLLVTGGGKGIAAECALALARETGVRLALLGRSAPDEDAELEGNLRRMRDTGTRVEYLQADITDRARVEAAVRDAQAELGRITAVLHGAGTNVPCLVENLNADAFLRTLAPKVRGLENVLAALDTECLQLLLTFSSIIARIGLPGEGDYGVANEWLSHLTERFQEEHPDCRCLALEWSIWSGVGMGERLGRVATLLSRGITPIPPEQGVSILRELIQSPRRTPSVVVAGRFGDPPTLSLERPEVPLMRFIQKPRVHYPRIEMVTDVVLSAETDPYIKDHVYDGRRILPAVMILEAMAQVARALSGANGRPVFEKAKFRRAVVVPENGPLTVRLAALARNETTVEVVLRSEETDFQVDYATALCSFVDQDVHSAQSHVPLDASTAGNALALEPGRDLYTGLLFHRGRFQRLSGYRRLRATECIADISPSREMGWFGWFVPGQLLLGDPGARDAAIHAVQACIPHSRLLPVGVRRITPACLDPDASYTVHALERHRRGDLFVYDVTIIDAEGAVQETWEGLELRKVENIDLDARWPGPLLVPYLEWRVRELIPGTRLDVALCSLKAASRRDRTAAAIHQATGERGDILHRPDGKPEVFTGTSVSVAHADGLTLAVAGQGTLGCDMELISKRPASTWRDLLGPERFKLAELIRTEIGGTGTETEEDLNTASTRVWAAVESLKKAGAAANAPLVLESTGQDRWILLRSGSLAIGTYVTGVRETEQPFCVALLVGGQDGNERVQ